MTDPDRHARRAEAAARVRATYPPLSSMFAALRAETVADPAPTPPAPDPAPEAEPAYVPTHAVEPDPSHGADPLVADFVATVAGFVGRVGGDADDYALSLAVAAEHAIVAAEQDGVRAARAAGVPGDAAVQGDALDAVIAALYPYATDLAAAVAAGEPLPEPHDVFDRMRQVARSAGVLAAVRDAPGWVAVQRFGAPYCPRPECYGRDGARLDAEWVGAHGLPPYGDGCTCSAEPTIAAGHA